MGKKARLRKELAVEAQLQERRAIEHRAKERQAPYLALVKRVALAAILTLALLYVGTVVNHRLVSHFSVNTTSGS